MARVNPVPDDYPRVTPYLCVGGAAHAIEFYATVFGALERMRVPSSDGRIGHAELAIGDGLLMLADEHPEIGFLGPTSIGGTAVTIHVFVEDVDDVFDRALQNGATEIRELTDQFYGERSGQFEDPWGHRWHVSSRTEELSAEEIARRAAQNLG